MTPETVNRQLFELIAGLIVLSFAFRVILMLIGAPVRLVATLIFLPLAGGRFDRAGRWAVLLAPPLLAVLYGCFIALVTLRYASASRLGGHWIYPACGGATALLSLISYSLGLEAKAGAHLLGPRPEDRAWRITSKTSLLAGAVASVLAYLYPDYIYSLPGALYLFDKAHLLAAWLSAYKAVQVILVLGIAGYFTVTTAAVLFQGALEAVDWLKVKILSFFRRY